MSHFVWADDVDLRKGRTNKLGYTIWMPELDTENVMRIPSPTTLKIVYTTLTLGPSLTRCLDAR